MNRKSLIDRVSRRASDRYGVDFSEALFDDLIDDGLIQKGERLKNEGKHPVYEFGWRSYRRALQIARLRGKDVVGRDAIRVQLFLSDYSEPVWDMREALGREYERFGKNIANQIRSGYADNWKVVPFKHKESFIRQAGVLDPRFEAAGLRLPADQLIGAFRNAKQKPVTAQTKISQDALRAWLLTKPQFQEIPESLLRAFSGLLMFNPDPNARVDTGDIRKLFSADDEQFVRARRLYKVLIRSSFAPFWAIIQTAGSSKNQREASEAARSAIKNQPEFAASVFVQCLRLIQDMPVLGQFLSTDENCAKVLNLLSSLYESDRTGPKD
jgi:hypothetical protein